MTRMAPSELSAELLRRYSERDLDGLVAMFSEAVTYVRPDGVVIRTVQGVRDQYLQDWSLTPSATAQIRRTAVDRRTVFAEVVVGSDEPVRWRVNLVAIHVWSADDRISEYRVYSDALQIVAD